MESLTTEVINERVIPMKDNRWNMQFIRLARTAPARGVYDALPADPLIWAIRGILIAALGLGCLGTGALPSAGHVDAHHPAGITHLAASASPTGPTHIIGTAWMY